MPPKKPSIVEVPPMNYIAVRGKGNPNDENSELWTAKMCIDAYLKNYLLKIIEMYSVSKYQVDVWHDGRFLDRWAERKILSDLERCFAHYDREDMVSALVSTLELFCRLASQTAEMKGYKYPKEAENYTEFLLEEAK